MKADPHPGPDLRGRFADLWSLRPDVVYLNHGSFGACPRAILDYQRALQVELEREPVDFLCRELPKRLAATRASLGAFIGADPDDLALLANATAGVNAVLRSLDLRPGDELLTTDHAYGACRKTLEYVAARAGAVVTVADVPFPLNDEAEILGPILGAVTGRTRLALIDHVTSPTALVLPIERIVRELEICGVDALVDGAHALGMVPLNLTRLNAAYYTSNAHKWLCAPKGAAFLHVRRDRQGGIHPTAISHGYDPASARARFREEFDWTGTADPSAILTIPECLRFLGELLPGGWPEWMSRNRELALSARRILCEALGVPAPCPESMIAAMVSVPIPAVAERSPLRGLDHEQWNEYFRERGFEAWFFPWGGPGAKLTRVSAQQYLCVDEIGRFAAALTAATAGGAIVR